MEVSRRVKIEQDNYDVFYDEPDHCPLCNHAIKPEELFLGSFKDNKDNLFVGALFLCKHCYHIFTVKYQCPEELYDDMELTVEYIGPTKYSERRFDKHISRLSPAFTKIYNQASEAEATGLDEIAGIGYRKALEFLIKDYLINLHPEEEETIKKMELGNCIANKVTNESIKAVASRSTWLGNDITHYVQRFKDKDINDMKNFIEATVYWISMELITQDALSMEKRV